MAISIASLWHASIATAAAPDRVIPLAPAADSSMTTATPTFSWQALPDATYYLLRVIDWTSTTVDRWYSPAAANCSTGTGVCSATFAAPLPAGPLTWQMLAWSPAGYGQWNEARSFAIDVADPLAAVAQPLAPSGTLWSHTATYTWTPVANAVLYRLAISFNGGPATVWWFAPTALGCSGGSASCAMGLTVAVNGAAQWQVQAWTANGHGNWSSAMDVSFTVFPAPTAPTAIAPTGSAGASPTFTWTAPDHVVYYYLRVDDVTGNRVDQWLTPAQAGCTTAGATCAFAPAVVLQPGSAQWRVLAWNPTGYSSFSSTVTFTVSSGTPPPANVVPNRVTLIGPQGPVSATPAFSWNAQAAATYYLVKVTDWVGTSIDRWFTPGGASCASGSGVCSASIGAAITPGPATWKVIAWSPAGYSPWSSVIDVVIETPDPTATAPQPIAPSGSLWSHSATFTWSAVPAAVLYRVSTTFNGGAATDSWYTPLALGCVSAGPCGVARTVATNGSIQWRVQAWTAIGHSDWSTPMDVSFAVFPEPATPGALTPNGATSLSPTFTWTASQNVVYYYIRVDDVTGNRIARWLTPVQAGCADGTGTCAFAATIQLSPGAAHWHVLAWNPTGYSSWSSTIAIDVVP